MSSSMYLLLFELRTLLFVSPPYQEQQRRAPNMELRIGLRTSSWSSKIVWRSVRGTNQRSSNSFRKSLLSPSPPTSPRWSRLNRVSWMEPLNGQPRSASQVRGASLSGQYSRFDGTWPIWSASTSGEMACVGCWESIKRDAGGAVEQKVMWQISLHPFFPLSSVVCSGFTS